MNSFQLTFRHLVDANNILAEPPPLHPAPSSIPPTSSCSSVSTPASSSSSGPTPASSSSSGPLEFITSERDKPKLIHDGYHYTYHQTRNSGHVAWGCVHNNKSCRTKGISCSATAVTTGTTTSSSLEYAKPHSHLPDPSKIAALKIIDTTKNDAVVQPTVPPSNIVSLNLIGVADDVECYLPAQTSLKKTVRRRRRKDAVTLNPDLALADERSLLSLTIPAPWKFFDSGPGPDRVLILTTDANLDFLCESVRWCGDGTFKAAPKLWSQLYTIHGQKNGYTCLLYCQTSARNRIP